MNKDILILEILKHLPGQHDQLRHAPAARGRRSNRAQSSFEKTIPGTHLPASKIKDAYERAKSTWGRFLKMKDPIYGTEDDMARLGISAIAAIDLIDHQIYHSMGLMKEKGLDPDNLDTVAAILAHEVGHHVVFPGNQEIQGRTLEAIKNNLGPAGQEEDRVQYLSNLWQDLLINNRIYRSGHPDIAKIYEAFGKPKVDKDGNPVLDKDGNPVKHPGYWKVYLRSYEILFGLGKGSLTQEPDKPLTAGQELDSQVLARLVKMSDRNQVAGSGFFASIMKPYMDEKVEPPPIDRPPGPPGPPKPPGDDPRPGRPRPGDEPDDDEPKGPGRGRGTPKPPILPPDLSQKNRDENKVTKEDLEKLRRGQDPDIFKPNQPNDGGGNTSTVGDDLRTPVEYRDLLKRLGYDVDPQQATIQYYKDLANKYAVRLPTVGSPTYTLVREGTADWETTDPLADLSIEDTLMQQGIVIPGETTRKIRRGIVTGHNPITKPVDLAIYVDCSGSMPDPSQQLSFPALAGTILATNAISAGSKVRVVLWSDKGHPLVTTDGFSNQENDVLGVLTSYAPGGTDFPNDDLNKMIEEMPRDRRKQVHAVVLSDYGIDTMHGGYDKTKPQVSKKTPEELGGGTAVLDTRMGSVGNVKNVLTQDGWDVHEVGSPQDLLDFARKFSEKNYGEGSQ